MKSRPCPFRLTASHWCVHTGLALAVTLFSGLCAAATETAPQEGWRIMNERNLGNCVACHALPGQTGVLSNFGPTLQGVGARYSAAQLQQWVVDARQIHAQTLMPPFGTAKGLNGVASTQALLTPEQIANVVATLAQWR